MAVKYHCMITCPVMAANITMRQLVTILGLRFELLALHCYQYTVNYLTLSSKTHSKYEA